LTRPVALTIAGVDSSGGAGIAADLKTFEAHAVWGTCAVTAVTAQNTLGVQVSESVSPEVVRAQIASVASDIRVDAAKTGMLVDASITTTVFETVRQLGIGPLVVDPVLMSGHGDSLLDPDGVDVLREMLAVACVATPNLAEAAALVQHAVDSRESMEAAAEAICALGPRVVMITGGHLGGESSPDCIWVRGEGIRWLESPRVDAPHHHGSGCVLSAAVTAGIANGMEASDACVAAKAFTHRALAAGLRLGSGTGPVDPGWARRSD